MKLHHQEVETPDPIPILEDVAGLRVQEDFGFSGVLETNAKGLDSCGLITVNPV